MVSIKLINVLAASLMCFSVVPVPTSALTKPSGVELVNNEYTGIVVAIHESEPNNPDLITAIKDMFTNASSYLYIATRQRAVFKEVTILVPQSWSDDPSYEPLRNERFDDADIIIALRNPRYEPKGDIPAAPYTKHIEGCGKQAEYIHFTSSFLLDRSLQKNYGDFGRVLVHEWGHFRWGLFNEYPDEVSDIAAEQFYFSLSSYRFEPVACSRAWKMIPLKYTGNPGALYTICNGDEIMGYEEGCIPFASETQPSFSASIMHGHLQFEQIIHFCDNNTASPETLHNREAPNKHNRLCKQRSNWEVMREHPDFTEGVNGPRLITSFQPTFKVVKSKAYDIVMVLDTSGSMGIAERATRLSSAARSYITSTISDGCRLGIIDFDNVGKVLIDVIDVQSDAIRHRMAQLIAGDASGGTCIGCGIESALGIMSSNGKIILITDGQDGEVAKFTEMEAECIRRGVIVDSIAYSDNAQDNIRTLAEKTGGKFYLQTDDPHSTGASGAFNANSNCGNTATNDGRITLLSSVYSLTGNMQEHRETVTIDPSVGLDTTFVFAYFASGDAIDVMLISPSSTTIDSSYAGYNRNLNFKKITIEIDGIAESGEWTFIITNRYTYQTHDVAFTLSSYPSQEGVDPITVTSFLSGTAADIAKENPFIAYAEVRQGFFPVVNATVIATIERPNSADGTSFLPYEMPLFDGGYGFDITANDGIYTRSFTKFTGIGYYGISVRVENNGEAVILTPTAGSRADPYFSPEKLLQGILPTYGDKVFQLPGAPEPEVVGVKAPNFTRGVSGGAGRVSEIPSGWTPETDFLPPGQITDLTVTSVDFDTATVSIQFTAPGDDLDNGRASRYVIFRTNSSETLLKDIESIPEIDEEEIIYGNLTSPSEFGVKETFVFYAPYPEIDNVNVVSYVFAVYAVDEVGNKGDLSNLVQATLRRFIPPAVKDITTTMATTTLKTTSTTEIIEACPLPCLNSGICTRYGTCSCGRGYTGRRCETVICNIQCMNGGVCSKPDKCNCSRGYTGQICAIAICAPHCRNGGICSRPGMCTCPVGFYGNTCETAHCHACKNGGVCMRQGVCKCPPGFTGNNCGKPTCEPYCTNGGRCVGKNTCSCTSGYSGKACEQAKCVSGCRNGGTCLKPNVCLCRPRYSGGSCHIVNRKF